MHEGDSYDEAYEAADCVATILFQFLMAIGRLWWRWSMFHQEQVGVMKWESLIAKIVKMNRCRHKSLSKPRAGSNQHMTSWLRRQRLMNKCKSGCLAPC